ncbi:hypothetical protein TW65_71831 [Stemphylium lycopersici]|nr:hypothetical protein TW65_71831 [Stemphylium lycopersici]
MATSKDSPSDYVIHSNHPNQSEGPLSPTYCPSPAFDFGSFGTPVGSGEPLFSGQDADLYASQFQSFGGAWNQHFEENYWNQIPDGPPAVQNQAHNVSQAGDTSSELATQVHSQRQAESARSPLHAQSKRLGLYQDSSALGFSKSRLAPALHGQERPLEAPLQNPYPTRYTRPKLSPTKSVMTEESGKSVRNFPCSFRAAQERLSLPYTCSAPPVTTVSALRTHLKRPLPGKRPPHLAFLKCCPTCNEDILDKLEFEERHGTEKCTTPRPQRKGDEGQARQYEMLCAKVERHIRNAALNADQSGVRNTSIADPPHVLIRDTPTEYGIGQIQGFPVETNIQFSSWGPLSSQGTRTFGEREPPPTFVPRMQLQIEPFLRVESLRKPLSAPKSLPRSLSFWSKSRIHDWSDAMGLHDNEQEYPLESDASNLHSHITPNQSIILDEDRNSGSCHEELRFTQDLPPGYAPSTRINTGGYHSPVNKDATPSLTSQNIHVTEFSPPAGSGTFLKFTEIEEEPSPSNAPRSAPAIEDPPPDHDRASHVTANNGIAPKQSKKRKFECPSRPSEHHFASHDTASNLIASNQEEKRKFQCPQRVAELAMGRNVHACTGVEARSMAKVRRHMVRGSRGRPPHLQFLKLCPTCNEDITDQDAFENEHGAHGELCQSPRKQHKGPAAQQEQWDGL